MFKVTRRVCAIFHFPQQFKRASGANPYTSTWSCDFLNVALLVGRWWSPLVCPGPAVTQVGSFPTGFRSYQSGIWTFPLAGLGIWTQFDLIFFCWVLNFSGQLSEMLSRSGGCSQLWSWLPGFGSFSALLASKAGVLLGSKHQPVHSRSFKLVTMLTAFSSPVVLLPWRHLLSRSRFTPFWI